MTRLENSEFLKSLADLLTKSGGESSVYLSQKRLTPAKSKLKVESDKIELITEPKVDESNYPILLRITDGAKLKKTKFSTIVEVDKLDDFWLQYTNVLKNGITGLKKKEKKKKNKKKVVKN